MLRKIKRIISAGVLLSLACTMVLTANASFIISIERTQQGDSITQRMKVQGEASEELRYKPVSLLILRPDMTIESTADFGEKYAAIYQTYVRADNKYVFNFPFNEEEGEYTVLLRVNDEDILSRTIECYSIEELVRLLDGVKNQTLSKEELCDLLTLSYENIGVDGELFSQLEDDSRLSISEAIMNSMTEYTVDELSHYLAEKTFITAFSSDDTTELREKVIFANMNLFGEETRKLCEMYFSLDEEIRKNVLAETKTHNVENLSDIPKALLDSCFVCEFREIDNFSEISSLISAYDSDEKIAEIKEELKAFSSSRQNIILRNILKKSDDVDGVDSFANVFSLLADDIERLERENNKPSGSGGGGGGGGGISKKNESTVTVTPPEKEDEEEKEYTEIIEKIYFDDIHGVDWAIEAINALTSKSILNGREKGKFAPYENITRAEFSKICTLALNIVPKNNEDIPFKDVREEHWAYEYIKNLFQNGFIQGVSPDSFNPDAEITRQDIATILFRIVTMRGYEFNMESFSSEFSDNTEIASYALPAVAMLSHKGVILGFDDNEFKPLNNATRAETAVVIHRIMKMLQTEGIS